MKKLNLSLAKNSYSIYIGDGILMNASNVILPLLPQKRVIIIADENLNFIDEFASSLDDIIYDIIKIKAGEEAKSYTNLQWLLEKLLSLKIDRKTTIIAIGGGVIGDLVGFAASIIMRGVPFIQIPTTLLAQVDSSVGGKTGINSPQGKNLIGSFYQPKAVLIDISTLKTLPKRQIIAGYAEILKYSLINDVDFFGWLEENAEKLIAVNEEALIYAISKSCSAKAKIVEADEKENGVRALLNLGHTFGHALEKEAAYNGIILHGEAVAIGCVMAFSLSEKMGFCNINEVNRLISHLQKVGLPTNLSDFNYVWNAEKLLANCYLDKKTAQGKLNLILANAIGDSFIAKDIDDKNILHIFQNF